MGENTGSIIVELGKCLPEYIEENQESTRFLENTDIPNLNFSFFRILGMHVRHAKSTVSK